MEYQAYGDLDGVPNVIVDGSAHPETLITLSHWPNSPTPVALRDDVSAQIAFHYLDHPELHVPATVVSNNHFDQDGLMSIYTLVDPDGARSRRARVIDVALAGDFGTYRDRDAIRVAWTIAVLEELLTDGDPYSVLLELVPDLLDHPDRFREHWAAEDEHLAVSEAAITSGAVTIEEIEDLDLAVVTVPADWAAETVHRFTKSLRQALHPTAVNNATDRCRVLYLHGAQYDLEYRYETWVRFMSRRPPGRIDLTPLATDLTALEPGDAHWIFDGVDAITPKLHLAGAGPDASSAISPDDFRAHVVDALTTGVVTRDPYP